MLEESLQVMDDSLWDLDGVGDIKVAHNDNKMVCVLKCYCHSSVSARLARTVHPPYLFAHLSRRLTR